jgi:hypothetical protein
VIVVDRKKSVECICVFLVNVLWVLDFCDGFFDARTIFVAVCYDFLKIQYHVWSVWSFWLLLIIGAPLWCPETLVEM